MPLALCLAISFLHDNRSNPEEWALRFTVARNLDELEAEIAILSGLAEQALSVEETDPERKMRELRTVLESIDLFGSGEKLLVFTEAKNTLDYLNESLTPPAYPP